ncbi:MAG: 50S ribosomal protein L10 [Hyphomicrobiaceae bacterium]
MDRAAKAALVTQLRALLKNTGLVVVAHYAGMNVAQMTDYRRRVKDAGGMVKVAKNRLTKLALKDTDAAGVAGLFKGQTCFAMSQDPVPAAKAVVKYAKENGKLAILGAAMGKVVLDPDGVRALAELPSLDELRAQLLGVLMAPAAGLVRVVNEPAASLARVIHARTEKEAKAA